MLRLRLAFLALCGVAIVCYLLACGDDGGGSTIVDNDRDSGNAPLPAPQENDGDDAARPQTTMRVAHLAPEIGPIDFCYQAAKTGAFVGPVLKGTGPAAPISDGGAPDGDATVPSVIDASLVDASPDDAASTDAGTSKAIAYQTMSKYLVLDVAGPLTVAIVGINATSCANPIVTADVTLDPGKLSTVALFGGTTVDGGPSVSLAAFTDDRTTSPEKARVRVIHAALGTQTARGTGPLAFRAVAATTTTLAERVEPKRASTASQAIPVDALGYASVNPVAPPTSVAIAAASSGELGDTGVEQWASAKLDLDLSGDSLHTAFVLSNDVGHIVLWCADRSTAADLTACRVVR